MSVKKFNVLFYKKLALCCTIMFCTSRVTCGTVTFFEDTSVNDINQPKATTGLTEQTIVKQKVNNITILGDDFLLNGEKLHIVSGSLHYFRLPAKYWKDRLMKLKAAGLNSVSTYVEWSYHEPEERQYNFEGDRDVAHFVQLAAEVGLHVLLRPGPYICAERDLGGLPYWLLGKYQRIKLRTVDKDFISETKIWFDKLFSYLSPLLFGNGGPIILVQVENEYGSYGNDKKYMGQLRDMISSHVKPNAILYTTDGTYEVMYKGGSIDGALTTIDFGVGANIPNTFAPLRKFMPQGPLMNSEFYPGWLTHWGESFQRVDTAAVTKTLRDMMTNGINLNFYMFFGGSNFEFTAGANFNNVYQPDITSYDYDAPLSEAGDPTPKYYAIREVLETFFPNVKNITLPLPSSKGAYGTITVQPQVKLLSPEGRKILGKAYKPLRGEALPTFEQLRQRAGLMLYETSIASTESSTRLLTIAAPRDRIYVFINDVLQGTISRMHKQFDVPISNKENSKLSLLVENQGRINYGSYIHDYKGILSGVKVNGRNIHSDWTITGFPLETFKISESSYQQANYSEEYLKNGPIMYEGFLTLPDTEEPKETFIDTSGWGKGYIWVNGNNLGRYWPHEGPQVTLYLPGVWLKAAPEKNHIQILELEIPSPNLSLKFSGTPILGKP